jgi:DNA-binding transcriptional regulator YdaS (Cro superfamily)
MHKSALLRAIQILGSQAALAQKIQVSRTRLNNWLNRDKAIPVSYAFLIEQATSGQVIWKELVSEKVVPNNLLKLSKNVGKQQSVSYELHSNLSLIYQEIHEVLHSIKKLTHNLKK